MCNIDFGLKIIGSLEAPRAKTAKRVGSRINLTFRISDSIKPVYYGGRTA